MTVIRSLIFGLIGAALIAPTARASELVMVERDGCHWCDRWDAEIAPIYPKTEEGQRVPLRRVNVQNLPDDIMFASTPVFTPTFVLIDAGHELGRLEGYAGDEFFWFLLSQLFKAHLDATDTLQ